MTYSNVPTRPQVEPVTYYTRRAPEWENANTWCEACKVHGATVNEPLCPVCLDRKRQP